MQVLAKCSHSSAAWKDISWPPSDWHRSRQPLLSTLWSLNIVLIRCTRSHTGHILEKNIMLPMVRETHLRSSRVKSEPCETCLQKDLPERTLTSCKTRQLPAHLIQWGQDQRVAVWYDLSDIQILVASRDFQITSGYYRVLIGHWYHPLTDR
jgi:hypothetical protein